MNFKFDKYDIRINSGKVIINGIIEVDYRTTNTSDFIPPDLTPLVDILMVTNPKSLSELRDAALNMWKALEDGHCAMHNVEGGKYLVYGNALSDSYRQIVATMPDMINVVVDGSLSKTPSLTLSTDVHTARWTRRIDSHIDDQISEGMDCLSDVFAPSPIDGK